MSCTYRAGVSGEGWSTIDRMISHGGAGMSRPGIEGQGEDWNVRERERVKERVEVPGRELESYG